MLDLECNHASMSTRKTLKEEHSSAASAASSSFPYGFSKPVPRKPVNSSSNRMGQIRSYWNSMTADRKLRLSRASIPELKSHCDSLKEFAMRDLLSEALSFAEESGSWEFWICFKCSKKFPEAMSYLNHVSAHIGVMSNLRMETIPEELSPDWVHMLTNISLKPIDVDYVIRSSDEGNNRNSLLNDTDSDNSDYASSFNCLEREVKVHGDCREKMESIMNSMHYFGGKLNTLPMANDIERVKLLEKIQHMFSSMIKHRCLSTRHVRKLLEFTNDQIKAYFLPSYVLVVCGEELERTPLGLCFLDASKLRVVLTFLQELSLIGGLQKSQGKDASSGIANGDTNNGPVLETVKLDNKSSTLSIEGGEVERGLRDANSLFQWIYAGPPVADRLAAWVRGKAKKSNQVLKLVDTLERELLLCQTLCDRKLEYLGTLKLLELLENLREEKGLCYEEFLKRRYNELMERQGEGLLIWSKQDELVLIRSLVKEAYQQFKENNCVYENGVWSRLQYTDVRDVDERTIQDFGAVGDGLISYVLSRRKGNLNAELNKLDVQIMRRVEEMRLLELKLGRASLFDYRFVLIPLIKSFVRTRLEELMDKGNDIATATEVFVQLAKDAQKISLKGDTKQSNVKSGYKKKGRDYRKSKFPKGSSKDAFIHEETTENLKTIKEYSYVENFDDLFSSTEASSSDNTDGITSDEDLNQDEEETKRMVELKAEERKLRGAQKHQRKLEDKRLERSLKCERWLKDDTKKKVYDVINQLKPVNANSLRRTECIQKHLPIPMSQFSDTLPVHLKEICFDDFHYSDEDQINIFVESALEAANREKI